jgi:hypothetical protein
MYFVCTFQQISTQPQLITAALIPQPRTKQQHPGFKASDYSSQQLS